MYGREVELAQIERVLEDARSGRSTTLRLIGEAGIGKTTLINHIARLAADFCVVRCSGVDTEAELPYAALHLMLLPFLDRLDTLPLPQANALRAAFGFIEKPSVDRFLVGLATLTLFSDIAADGPLLCLVDDAFWLDHESATALAFASRRLDAEGVVIIFVIRGETSHRVRIPQVGKEVRLSGLSDAAANTILDEHAPHLSLAVRNRLIEASGGNPLALTELAGVYGSEQQTRQMSIPTIALGASPGGSRLQDAIAGRIGRLPERTRRLLLVAAADDTGEVPLVFTAARSLGLDLTDLTRAEQADLVQLSGTTLTFSHPLIRAVVYGRSSASERVAAHRALAEALDAAEHPDRRVWHLAAATIVPDEAVAATLEGTADRALRRGAYAASAAAYERAALLSADPVARGRRLVAAAETARDCAQLAHAAVLAEKAARLVEDPATEARVAAVRARIEFERGTPRRASDLIVRGVERIIGTNPERAGRMLGEAMRMAYFANGTETIDDATRMLESLPMPPTHPLRPMVEASAIVGRLLAGQPPAEVRPLHEVVRCASIESLGAYPPSTRNHLGALWMLAGRAEETYEEVEKLVSAAREQGLIGGLPHMLLLEAEAALAIGWLRTAMGAGMEGLRIAEDTGQDNSASNLRSVVARVAAMTGDDQLCVRLAEESMRCAEADDTAANVVTAALALCVHDLGHGMYASAFNRLNSLSSDLQRHPILAFLAPPDQIEAAVRSGHEDRADDMLERYETWTTRHQDRPVARAIAYRCRALLSHDEEADGHFQAALGIHRQTGRPLARARTELLYGEWLRRGRRRSDAREHLHWALQAFEHAGAAPWAERARAELRATGETVARASDQERLLDSLTPQELQVAKLAAAGLTNRDIGARLFVSPRTVGYHLYKIYPKLGISRRTDLARMRLD